MLTYNCKCLIHSPLVTDEKEPLLWPSGLQSSDSTVKHMVSLKKEGYFSKLHNSTSVLILSYMSLPELANFSCTNRLFKQLFEDDTTPLPSIRMAKIFYKKMLSLPTICSYEISFVAAVSGQLTGKSLVLTFTNKSALLSTEDSFSEETPSFIIDRKLIALTSPYESWSFIPDVTMHFFAVTGTAISFMDEDLSLKLKDTFIAANDTLNMYYKRKSTTKKHHTKQNFYVS